MEEIIYVSLHNALRTWNSHYIIQLSECEVLYENKCAHWETLT